MGGGTGTGGAPVVAQIAREIGILTVAVITKPFPFEGRRRMEAAQQGVEELSKYVDSVITIPNEKLLTVLGKSVTLLDAFKAANNVLHGAVQGIAELITKPGLINVDFADVRTVMSEMGLAMMGTGVGSGEERAQQAAQAAISSPLLEDVHIAGAKGILVNITAGMDFAMDELEVVGSEIEALAQEDANVVIGTVIDPEMQDEIRVTLVATGLGTKLTVREAPPSPFATKTEASRSERADYDKYTRPTIMRKARPLEGSAAVDYSNSDYLDIPAFLRKQAD